MDELLGIPENNDGIGSRFPRLKELRIKNDYSQKQLADLTGHAQNTISNWETGKRGIDIKDLIKLADLYNVTTDYILGIQGPKDPAPNPLQDLILSIFEDLNNAGKREAIKRVGELSRLSEYQADNIEEL